MHRCYLDPLPALAGGPASRLRLLDVSYNPGIILDDSWVPSLEELRCSWHQVGALRWRHSHAYSRGRVHAGGEAGKFNVVPWVVGRLHYDPAVRALRCARLAVQMPCQELCAAARRLTKVDLRAGMDVTQAQVEAVLECLAALPELAVVDLDAMGVEWDSVTDAVQ